jgi:hypothetical protein
MDFPKTYRTNAGWALSIGATLALFSNLRNEQRAVISLAVLGGAGFLWSAWEHGWVRLNRKSIPRVLAILGGFFLIAWFVWPPGASKKTDFSISDPRSIINMKRNFQDTSPLWARYVSGYGDTISPVAVAAWIDITNNLDVLETVKDYSVAINTQQCGWVYLVPIRMRSTSFFFIGAGQIQRALPLDFTTDGLDYILERPISPHGTVSGWLMFDTQVKCNVINGESIQYRVSFSTFSGKSLDIVTEFRQLRNDMLIPGSSHANMTGPILINKPGVADLSKCYVRFYSDEVK